MSNIGLNNALASRLHQKLCIAVVQRQYGHLLHQKLLACLKQLHALLVVRKAPSLFHHAVVFLGLVVEPAALGFISLEKEAVQIGAGVRIIAGPAVIADIEIVPSERVVT